MTYVDTRRLISRIQVIYTINFNTTNNFTTSSRTKELLRRFWDKVILSKGLQPHSKLRGGVSNGLDIHNPRLYPFKCSLSFVHSF